MKKYIKISTFILIVYVAIAGCDKSEFSQITDLEEQIVKNQDEILTTNDSIKLGDNYIYPLKGTLTNLISENCMVAGPFDDTKVYSYLLKLEKLYGNSAIESKGGGGVTNCTGCLSYSINFKFFTGQKDGPSEGIYTIEYLNDILSYYKALDNKFTNGSKAVAFLYGDITFDPDLDFNEYKKYRDSQVRIKSGILNIKKSGNMYQISFKGETETGIQVSCNFNDTLTFVADNQIENSNESFSTNEIPENYILKDGKYHKLDEGQIYLPYNSQNNTVRVLLRSYHDYYWYENNDDQNYEWYPGKIAQRGRQNAVILQFQFENTNQFQSKTFQVVPSEVNTGYDYQFTPTEQVEKFPSDSLCIGFYHISADMNYIEWMSLGYSYGFTDYYVLQSGKLEVTKQSSDYEFFGKFTDSQSKHVTIKFKTTGTPIQYNN